MKTRLVYGFVALFGVGLFLTFSSTVSAEPTNNFPNQSDVTPSGNILSTQVGKTNFISVQNTYLNIYSATPRISVSIAGADLCGGTTLAGTRDAVYDINGIAFGDRVSEFTLSGFGPAQSSDTAYGNKRTPSNCTTYASNPKQFPNIGDNDKNPSGLPISTVTVVANSSKKVDTQQGELYVFQLRAQWNADGGCGGPHCALNTFRVSAYNVSGNTISGGSPSTIYVSQAGRDEGINGIPEINDSRSFGVGITNFPGGQFSNYESYFGTPCKITSNQNVYIEIYDDDNVNKPGAQDPANPFRVRLEEAPAGTTSWVQTNFSSVTFLRADGGSSGNINDNEPAGGGRTWKIVGTPGSKNKIQLGFVSKPNTKYRFIVNRLDATNNVQFQLPYPGYMSARTCASWNLEPVSEVSSESVTVGTPVTWRHTVQNIGGANSPGGQSWNVVQTGASSGNGTRGSGSLPALAQESAPYTVPGSYSYTPTNADVGRTICQRLTVSPFRPSSGSRTAVAPPPQCFTVAQVLPVSVQITPTAFANFGGEVEADNPVGFSGAASVSNFPPIDKYGYDNQSQKLAPQRVVAQATNGPYDTQPQTVSAQSGPHTACSNGASPPSCYSPPGYYCFYSYGSPGGNGCAPNTYRYDYGPSYGYTYTYYMCPSGGYSSNGNGTCTRTTYRCTETGGSYTYPAPSCRTYYSCEGGVPGQGWHYSPPLCDRWYCRYSDSPAYNQANPPTNCEYRCNGGTAPISANPGRALLTTDHVNGTPNRNCYVRPSFNLRCQWTTPGGAVLAEQSAVVTSNGSWCSSSQNRPPGQIGDTICLSYRSVLPTGWNETPPPARQNGVFNPQYGFQVNAPATACTRIVGKPYVRVLGDAAVGAALGATQTTCSTSLSATIRAQNKGASDGFSGSGASLAVLARGTISGFGSGQFANPILGSAPKAMTFANATGTFGGGWGSIAACMDASKFVAGATAPFPSGGGTVNGTQRYRVTNTNVVISGNIIYAGSATGWVSLESIPLMQLLVVGGNIYIDRNVSQLDGTYMALSQSGVGGNIYTCASGASQVTSTWTAGCNQRQLVVNGSLIADRVHLGRDCSTLNRSTATELTLYTGGSDSQQCDSLGRTKAAEVINFLPDQWIRSSLGVPSTRYDAVTNLAPIL